MKRTVQQAEISKQEADDNIDRKLNLMSGWLANGIPYRENAEGNTLLDGDDRKQLDFFPTSLRQFKAWDGSQNCGPIRIGFPSITATGNDTLAKRPAKQEQARRLIEALRQRAQAQTTQTSSSEVKRLTEELRIAQATIGIRNAELREQQRTLRRIKDENARLIAKVDGDAVEFKRVFEALTTELAEEKRKCAALTVQMTKIRPLHAGLGRQDGS